MNGSLPSISKNCGIRIALTIAFILTGCSNSFVLKHPHYPDYMHSIRAVLLLPPQIGAYRQMDDGTMVWCADCSRADRSALSQAVRRILNSKRLTVRDAGAKILQDPETQSIQALYRAVDHSIRLHVLGPQLFTAETTSFDYELGSVANLLKRGAADALVLAMGHQTVDSHQVHTWVSIALVEPQGRIIWYNIAASQNPALGFEPSKAMPQLVEQVLKPFTGASS